MEDRRQETVDRKGITSCWLKGGPVFLSPISWCSESINGFSWRSFYQFWWRGFLWHCVCLEIKQPHCCCACYKSLKCVPGLNISRGVISVHCSTTQEAAGTAVLQHRLMLSYSACLPACFTCCFSQPYSMTSSIVLQIVVKNVKPGGSWRPG